MKVRVIMTVEVPDSEAKRLKAARAYATDAQVRNLIREQAWSAVSHSDWAQSIQANVTREN